MTIEQRLAELPPLTAGRHHSLYDGVCVMEAAAYLAGEPWTDYPKCVCPTIGAFLRAWNDDLPDADRDRLLRPLTRCVIGSRSTRAVEARRSWIALDWLIREHAPAWLELVPGLESHAEKLRALADVHDVETVSAAQPVLTAASDATRDAWHAASAAARAVARAVARDAAWHAAAAAARAAARAAAWTAASVAARAAASNTAWAAASDTARNAWYAVSDTAAMAAAWTAAWYTASAAARAVASDAAAMAAARAALAPTVAAQQASALRLIDRMLAVTE